MIEGLQGFQSVFKIPELKRRVLITLGLLAAYRLGAHVPTPGIDGSALAEFFNQMQGTLLGMVDLFSGGNLRRLTVFALGIMPYISASIILQLLTVVIPALERLAKEGEAGKKKITQYTRYGTIVLSLVQSFGIAVGLESMRSQSGAVLVPDPGWSFRLLTMLTLTTGTALIMWLGEQISEKGIGNGISLIIFAGIVVRLPSAIVSSYTLITTGELQLFVFLGIIVMMVLVTAAVVIMQEGQRKIPVQYAKRVVGRRMYGGQSTHIPLRINTAGVIPVIFASSLILFPATLTRFIEHPWMQYVSEALSPGQFTYTVLYCALIIFFTYFYTAIVFNPIDLADNMKKYGGFIPGVRPGKKTAEYIDRTLTRITLPGAVFLALISVLPDLLIRWFNTPFYFGGTSLLIVVGVALDTVRQMESHLLMRNYEGFLKRRGKGPRMSGRVIFLGPPGVGKGTQASRLASEWGVPHVATGDMLREAAQNGTRLGLEAQGYMKRGALVPDEVVIGLVDERLGQSDAGSGWILDGFPRTVAQAEALGQLIRRRGLELDRVIFFQVAKDELLRRLTGRRICRECGSVFHLVSNPPAVAGRCDRCGGELYQRDDDAESAVGHRLEVYQNQTAPLLDYYRGRNMLTEVRGEGAVDQVAAAVRQGLREAVPS